MIGQTLSHFKITAKLGEGGMGVVYRAEDTRLAREVAIKVLPEEMAADPESLARFQQEAQTVSSLNHSNILTVYEIGTHEGSPYLVTELLEGETLRELLGRGPLKVTEALNYCAQIARGLATANEKGIVHRDLKPENLFLTKERRVKILDFGLARLVGPLERTDTDLEGSTFQQLTKPGTVMGTVGYMAPEQVRGEPADHRADIFSLGCVLYELLSGRKAFRKDSEVESLNATLNEAPPEISTDESGRRFPPSTLFLLSQCLEKEPGRRYQSAHDLALALETISPDPSGFTPDAAPITSPKRQRLPWILAAAGISVAAVTFSLAILGRNEPQPQRAAMRFEIPAPEGSSFENGISLSPDGSQLTFVAPGSTGEDLLWVRPLYASAARPLDGTEGASFPFWSPAGDKIAFFKSGKLQVVAIAGGDLQILCSAPSPRGGSWGSQETLLISIGGGSKLVQVPARGGEPTVVATPASGTIRHPSFLPDGRSFLFHWIVSGSDHGIWAGKIDAEEEQFIVNGDSGALYAHNGYIIYRQRERLVVQRFDTQRLQVKGPPVPLAEDVWWDSISTIMTAFTVSHTGILAYRSGGPSQSQLQWLDRSGRFLGAIEKEGSYFEPAISPDGGRVAMPSVTEAGVDIWITDVERGSFTRFTFGPEIAATPIWSADGNQLFYSTFPGGEIFRKDARGMKEEELILKPDGFWPLFDWLPVERSLLIVIQDGKKPSGIYRLAVEGDGRPEPLITGPFNSFCPKLSPSGDWLAYQSDESGVYEIYAVSYPDLEDRLQISTHGGSQPEWRDDGHELYYVAPDRKIMVVSMETEPQFEPGVPTALFPTHILPQIEVRNQYDVTSDGQKFLVNTRRAVNAPIVIVTDWLSELELP